MMLRSFLGLAAVMACAVIPGVLASDPAPEGAITAAQVMCPVMDEPVNFLVSSDTAEGPVYFCCAECVERYTADPAKYSGKVAAQRAALAKLPKVQVKCPLTGEPVNPQASAEQDGAKVQFCCQRCLGKFKSDPKLIEKSLAGCYSYQTVCPVSGEAINPKAFKTLPTGQTLYFCSKECAGKLLADPAQYNANLTKQGVVVDWEQVKAAGGGH